MKRNWYQQPQGRTLDMIPTNNPNNKHGSDGSADITLDATLSYLKQILLEEDTDEKDVLYTKESALYAMEKPLYDILGQNYPPALSVENPPLLHTGSSPISSNYHNLHQHSSNCGILSASEFNKGFEAGMKFLPRIDKLVLGMEANKLSFPQVPKEGDLAKLNSDIDQCEKNEDFMGCGPLGKYKSDADFDILEGRIHKISASYFEEPPRNEMFDEALLDKGNYTEVNFLQASLKNKTNKYYEDDQVGIVDLKALLIDCSHAVYANDRQLAEYLINQIRKLSSLVGDGTQRMASVFADALEARLNGTGSEEWRRIVAKRIPTSEFLKIAFLYITMCPFPRISLYYANQIILKAAAKASKLHIIDFGIGMGFQWPSLIQALSNNNNCKSIKLRITGIDVPLPGFRPAELIQETGRRLEAYAESFGVPFEYHGIASKFQDVSLEDLKIKEDEVLVVNCMFRLREVGDEAVSLDSPRNRVLNLIQQIRPHAFIHGIVNVTAFSPFFISRFKQALTLYSALFEILDTLVSGDNKQRQLIERVLIARDVHNVLACEGSDWIVKPESYKQWHLRNLQAGLEQIPLDPSLLKECKERTKKIYDNNMFFIEEDQNWFLQGWSGRIFHGISTWKAKLA